MCIHVNGRESELPQRRKKRPPYCCGCCMHLVDVPSVDSMQYVSIHVTFFSWGGGGGHTFHMHPNSSAAPPAFVFSGYGPNKYKIIPGTYYDTYDRRTWWSTARSPGSCTATTLWWTTSTSLGSLRSTPAPPVTTAPRWITLTCKPF